MQKHSTIVALCFGFHAAVAIGAPPAVPIRILRGYLIVAPVTVNGDGPHAFLVDTACTTTVLSSDLASKLRLSSDRMTVASTVSGPVNVGNAVVERIEMGAVSVGPIPILIANLEKLPFHIEGVLGQDFLKSFDYTIDYSRQTLAFGPDNRLEGTKIGFDLDGGRMLININAHALAGGPLRVVIDSALSNPTFFHHRIPPSSAAIVNTVRQRAMLSTVEIPELRIGEISIDDCTALFAAPDPSDVRTEDGLLPLRLFGVVPVSNSGQYLVVRHR